MTKLNWAKARKPRENKEEPRLPRSMEAYLSSVHMSEQPKKSKRKYKKTTAGPLTTK